MKWFGWFRCRSRVPSYPRLRDLAPYRGRWIAVRDGEILGHTSTATEMADMIISQNGAWKGCTAWFQE